MAIRKEFTVVLGMGSWVRSCVIVISSVAIATVLTFPLSRVTVHSRSLLFVAAVVLVSRFSGTWPGIATALLSVVAFDWYFDSTPFHLDLNLAGAVRAIVFLGVSSLVASLENQRRTALAEAVATNRRLVTALEEVKQLRGILPICMYCKQIRNDAGAWVALERYLHEHTEAEFSHGVCPACYGKHFPEIYNQLHLDKEEPKP